MTKCPSEIANLNEYVLLIFGWETALVWKGPSRANVLRKFLKASGRRIYASLVIAHPAQGLRPHRSWGGFNSSRADTFI